ncbi:hypothetical protein [Spiroplasma endosymbiont of Virgichneumon dumeticola]|uniref:hypothetical protein n=1 Tax=Spiroplasma endosymbiont of Virgichneumon dumeticola TaxID=3139323 RepID=UPI0035C8ABD4
MYEISTTNSNDKLMKILLDNKFHTEVHEQCLLVNIKTEVEVAKVLELSFHAHIIITYLKPYTVDLRAMYERIVMEAKQGSQKGDK